MAEGSSITLPSGSGLSKSGRIFDGWGTNADGTGTNYSVGATFTPTGNVTLFARWDINIVVPGTTLASQLAWLQANAQSGNYYLVIVTEDENISPHDLAFSGRNNITIILRGAGSRRTIGLSSNGSLFTIGSGVTLVLDNNIILQGRPSNNASLVQINSGGTLVMNAGSRVTGNNSMATIFGVGVRINSGGIFRMNGGELWGNASFSSIGGGGGVFVASGGTFDMHGGTVSDNWAGGRNGGGVYNAGTFRMSDGIIHGSNEAPGLRNTASNGAALFNSGTAQFGTFDNDMFTSSGTLSTTNNTLRIVTVTFNRNGGTGTVPARQTAVTGSAITLPDGSGLSRSGFIFNGWNTEACGTGNNFTTNSTHILTNSITLYANWSVPFTVTFNANGGSGTPPVSQTVAEGSSIIVPSNNELSRSGFRFGGWNTNAMGTGTNHGVGTTLTPTSNITLFARWLVDNSIPVPGTTLAAQLAWLRDNAQSNTEYRIEISGNENIAPQTLPTGRSNITITLRGIGAMRTVSLSSNGSLFTVGSGVTLELDRNVTLQGRNFNNSPLVQVNYGGILVMNAEARITGNTTSSNGGGVRINTGGIFTMHGGEISGNTVSNDWNGGGGVDIVRGGTFYMHGGQISNNSSGIGGGVFNLDGIFRISAGIIHGNNAEDGFRNIVTMWFGGVALYCWDGISQRGIFNGNVFSSLGALTTMSNTIHVVNGVLQP